MNIEAVFYGFDDISVGIAEKVKYVKCSVSPNAVLQFAAKLPELLQGGLNG